MVVAVVCLYNSMKQLVIAEKPSVAKDLAKALGKFKQNKEGYFEREDMLITSALGHLVELYMPGDFDAKYRYWSLKNLPILPEKFLLKPIEKTEERFNFLKKMMSRKDVDGLINACDAGREGELIFVYLCELANCDKPKQRLWLSSMTPDAIREAFEHLRTSESMQLLESAARCRSEADWLVGINGTRAVTGRMFGSRRGEIASVGRVQTPTLALICEREEAIKTFQPTPFWKISGNFEIKNGLYRGYLQRNAFKKQNDEDRSDRFWDQNELERLLQSLLQQVDTAWHVHDTVKITKQSAPKLFDLTSLQRECNQRFGYSAKFTLDLAQALYEKHKALTYPRTDSKALPEDYAPTCITTLQKLDTSYTAFTKKIIDNHWVNPSAKNIFNNKAISDHFAIIPTGTLPKNLKETEQKVYDLVVRRFIAVFFPAAEFAVTTRLTTLTDFTFKTEGKVLVHPGWLEVCRKTDTKESLPALQPEDEAKATAKAFELISEETRPPARFTEATLLASMEHAGQFVEDDELAEAMKEKGLGTPATRAQIIENLISTKYLERKEKELVPTAKADQLLEFLRMVKVQELASPALTGEWEYRLHLIQDGQLSREQFMSDIKTMASKIVESVLAFKDSESEHRPTEIISPSDGKCMVETFRAFKSQDGKISIFKIIGNRKMSESEIAELLKNRHVGPLDGFVSKFGKSYSATLELNDDYQVKFNFGEPKVAPIPKEELEKFNVIGKCPICGGKVYTTETAFVCENTQKETPCKFRVTKMLLSRLIPDDQFERLLKDGKTNLLDKFKSKRTGKFFSAHLILKSDGNIGFEFEKKTNAS